MEKLTYYTVFLDGIDKCGKDTIANYVWRLDKRLNVLCRGWPSLYVYAKKFNRNVEYDLPARNILFVQLTVDKEDWQIRCETTNEPEIDYSKDSTLFDTAFEILYGQSYNTMLINTSKITPYQAAKQIVERIEQLNGGATL